MSIAAKPSIVETVKPGERDDKPRQYNVAGIGWQLQLAEEIHDRDLTDFFGRPTHSFL